MNKDSLQFLTTVTLALGLALGSTINTPLLHAQSQSTNPNAQQEQQTSRTFMGKIVKARNGQYALLTDEKSGTGMYLDDQEKAKSFEGQNVKVTGVLDVARNIVRVTDIQPA